MCVCVCVISKYVREHERNLFVNRCTFEIVSLVCVGLCIFSDDCIAISLLLISQVTFNAYIFHNCLDVENMQFKCHDIPWAAIVIGLWVIEMTQTTIDMNCSSHENKLIGLTVWKKINTLNDDHSPNSIWMTSLMIASLTVFVFETAMENNRTQRCGTIIKYHNRYDCRALRNKIDSSGKNMVSHAVE